MTSILKKNVFGFGAVFAFCATWEITDIFGFALITLICINLLWASLKLAESIKLKKNIRQENEDYNLIFGEDYKPTPTLKILTIENLLPLYNFLKEHITILLMIIFFFFLLQEPFEKPYKNFALNLMGKEIEGSIIEDSNYIDETDYGEIDVNYQTAEFIVNGKKYLSHYDINWLDLNIHKKKRVIIEYLPLNPKINRFREDYTDKSYNLISILIRLLLSTIFPLSILVNYRKN